ncbi:MAG: lamin tail domain-containing protein [Candidatus Marinimicrobia bacterium]|nr:lamin tail domain-containing protein [Candidatus Neomarinimicrobiota bacterium]
MNRITVMIIMICSLASGQATDLFFSEYAEGSSNNKYLEIYNGTGSDVDLANYLVLGNYNGNPFNDTLRFPVGTMLTNGDVYVIANDKASSEIVAVADTIIEDPYASGTSYIAVFNGDDVRGLFKIDGTDTTCIDLFGFYDIAADTSDDPGSGWDVAGVTAATKDHTLVRKPTIKGGNTDWIESAGTDATSSEWVVLDKDTFTDLGEHTSMYSGVVWTFPDDSDHDYDGTNGRMVFQIGNSCIPDIQTRDVFAYFETIEAVGIDTEDILPLKFAVHENYPNPFNPITKISFDLPEFSPTKVTVWNMLGQKVATLYSGDLPSGRHTITFDARNDNGIVLPSGLYFYRVESGHFVATKKMMLLK